MNDIQELIAEARRTFRVAGSDLLLDLADALEALNKENEELTNVHTEYDEVIFGDEDESPLVAAKRLVGDWVPIPSSDPHYWVPEW